VPGGGDGLPVIAGLLVVFTLAKGATEYFSSYSMSHIGQHVIADLRFVALRPSDPSGGSILFAPFDQRVDGASGE
jgi:hypothetical protein